LVSLIDVARVIKVTIESPVGSGNPPAKLDRSRPARLADGGSGTEIGKIVALNFGF